MNRLSYRPEEHKPDSTLPLINIVLLLVLAFMIAGTFAAPLPEDFDPLRAADGEQAMAAKPLLITVTEDGTARIDGKDATPEQVGQHLANATSEDAAVEIRADARASANSVIRLLGKAEDAGLADVSVVTLRKKQ